MVKALILYADGRREVKDVKGVDEFCKIVGGSLESLPVLRDYVKPNKKTGRLMGFVNDSGMIEQLPSNPYAGILSILGVSIHLGIYVYGNVILFSENEDGDRRPIDPYIIQLFEDYDDCGDEDAFYCALEELNETVVVDKHAKTKVTLV